MGKATTSPLLSMVPNARCGEAIRSGYINHAVSVQKWLPNPYRLKGPNVGNLAT